MKTLKSILVAAFLFTCGLTFAQPPGGGHGSQQGPPPIPSKQQVEQMVDEIAIEVFLSPNQKEKILNLFNEHFNQLRAKTSGNNRPKKEEMEASKTVFEKKVKAELTQKQIRKYEAFLKKQKPRRAE